MAKEMDGDAGRLLNKYRLCKEFGWTPEQYDNMNWIEREKMRRIHDAIESKKSSLEKLHA